LKPESVLPSVCPFQITKWPQLKCNACYVTTSNSRINLVGPLTNCNCKSVHRTMSLPAWANYTRIV